MDIQNSIMIKADLKDVSKLKNTLSKNMLKKLALHKITYKQLTLAFKSNGKDGIQAIFTEKKNDNEPKITKNIKIIDAVYDFLAANVSDRTN